MKMQAKLLLGVLFMTAPAQADYVDDDFEIDVNNQGFENPRLEVPANTRIKLEVDNESDAVVEFYIPAIDLEIAVPAQTEREFYVDGFAPGEYRFENELNSSMHGTLVAK